MSQNTVFTISPEETSEIELRKKEHVKKCPYMSAFSGRPFRGIPASGEHWSYTFIPSGLGTHVRVRCLFCEEEIHSTDTGSW